MSDARWHRLTLVAALVSAVGLGAWWSAAGQAQVRRENLTDACATEDPHNPYLATVCYNVPMSQMGAPGARAVVAFRDTPANTPQYTLASFGQVGGVWGLAYRHAERAIFASSFHKRYVSFGPDGPGAIYRVPIDLPSPGVTLAISVPNAGPDLHDPNSLGEDEEARDWAGKTSLGDIDFSEDEKELFVVNLADRRVYRFGMPGGRLLGSFPHGAVDEPWAEDARPFGLKFHDGRLFHGVVNSAESTQDRDDLAAYVYSSEPDGADMQLVLSFPLTYSRGVAYVPGLIGRPPIEEVPIDWLPWRDGYNHIAADRAGQAIYPQPILSDIEFDDQGNMIVGLKDRQADMTLAEQIINPRGIQKPGLGIGDIIPARFNGMTWDVNLEEIEHWEGLAGKEFYVDGTSLADESAVGGLAQLWLADAVVSSAIALSEIGSRLVAPMGTWYTNPDGNRLAREVVICGQMAPPTVPPLGALMPQHNEWSPVADVGDMEVLCGEEPEASPTPTLTATPSPTPTKPVTGTPPPTVVDTPTSSATPTHSPTPTPTPTPTPEPYRIYVPILVYFDVCVAHADVVLVLDMSTSMNRRTGSGRPKYDAAVDAARLFVRMLELTPKIPGYHDQVAVAGFNVRSWTELALTNDRVAIEDALGRLPGKMQEGTRLDLAFREGQRAIDGPGRKPENMPVMIVLTDGIPNLVPFHPETGRMEETVLEAAQAAKDKGTKIFTIGLGLPEEIIEWLLRDAASDPPEEHYFYAPDGEDLREIYRRIAKLLPCPGVEPWPPAALGPPPATRAGEVSR